MHDKLLSKLKASNKRVYFLHTYLQVSRNSAGLGFRLSPDLIHISNPLRWVATEACTAPGQMQSLKRPTLTLEAHFKTLITYADCPLDKASHIAKAKDREIYSTHRSGREGIISAKLSI